MCTQTIRKRGANIKRDFESIVGENTPWLLRYVRSKLNNPFIAEDIVQEIWLRAFRAYDDYCEDGRLRAWLGRIAQNYMRSYFSQSERQFYISLDADSDDDDSLYGFISDGDTPEDDYIRHELIERVTDAIASLPPRQRQVFTYRYIEERTTAQTSLIMNIPTGTVKSAAHYAIGEIRRRLGVTHHNILTAKGDKSMECKEIYKYLFNYANGTISDEDRAKVDAHIADCGSCADVVSSLQKLIPTMIFAREDEMSHFLIDFPELHLSYCGWRHEIENYEALNKLLSERGGNIPDGEIWFSSGYGKQNSLQAMFDNEGNEIKFKIIEDDGSHYRVTATYIKRIYHYMWSYGVFTYENSPCEIKPAKEAPNLYCGSLHNCLGSDARSALYQAIPGKAENIRIKRGNGVIDCGAYKFPYVDRYITEDERISLDYSFVLER